MFELIGRWPGHWLYYYCGWPRLMPVNYTFSLSYNCNSRCHTCNIWKKAKAKELSRAEWHKIFQSLGKSPYWATFSGGEPFLRPDLSQVVTDFYQICQPKIITIPTNGLLTKQIKTTIQEILKNCPRSRVIVNLSLDGVGVKHDQLRGVPGNFKKAMITYKQLRAIKAANFTLGIHTVISRNNVKDFPQLCEFVLTELRPDSYVTEIAEERVELDTIGKKITPSAGVYQKAINYLSCHAPRATRHDFSRLVQAFRLTYYDLTVNTLKKKTQVIPCLAGIASAQIAPNGDVWPCCVRADVLGNLKAVDCDFRRIWFSAKAKQVRRSIKNKDCYCPLANVSYTNMLFNPKMLSRVMRNYFKS